MLRRLLILVLLAGLIVASVDAAAARKRVPAKAASVKVLECRTSDDGESRSATFQGRVRALRGSARMRMRFTLLERFGDERRHVVAFPELRVWHTSRGGIRDFRYKQTVTGLQGGGQYRMRVDFRWYDADGNLLRRARRNSGTCRQPGELANLRPGFPSAGPGPEGTVNYTVPVWNRGKATAKDVAVELSVDGAVTDVDQIGEIPAGARREVHFTGPACKGGVRVVVDPDDTVKERRERDNVRKAACPSGAR
jgi:hypothetical protein